MLNVKTPNNSMIAAGHISNSLILYTAPLKPNVDNYDLKYPVCRSKINLVHNAQRSLRFLIYIKEFTKAYPDAGGNEQALSSSRIQQRRRGVLQRGFLRQGSPERSRRAQDSFWNIPFISHIRIRLLHQLCSKTY